MKALVLKAHHIKIGGWFLVIRTGAWYKKEAQGETYVEASLPTDNKKHMIDNDEDVEVAKT